MQFLIHDVFGVIWVQNSNFFNPGQTIYQNEAFGQMINIKWLKEETDQQIASSQARG